jgi:hypothetical protein
MILSPISSVPPDFLHASRMQAGPSAWCAEMVVSVVVCWKWWWCAGNGGDGGGVLKVMG